MRGQEHNAGGLDVLRPYVVVGHEEDWLERHGTMNATVND